MSEPFTLVRYWNIGIIAGVIRTVDMAISGSPRRGRGGRTSNESPGARNSESSSARTAMSCFLFSLILDGFSELVNFVDDILLDGTEPFEALGGSVKLTYRHLDIRE